MWSVLPHSDVLDRVVFFSAREVEALFAESVHNAVSRMFCVDTPVPHILLLPRIQTAMTAALGNLQQYALL